MIWFLSPLALSGCWDINEPEQMVYANGMGADYKDDRYIVYIQLIDLGTSAKPEKGGKSTEPAAEIVWGTGKDIDEAIFTIYTTAKRRIYWGHLSYMVLTETALNKGSLQQMIDITDRYYETRYHLKIYATKVPLEKLFQLATYPSRLSDPESAYEQSSLIKPVTMREVILAIDEAEQEAVLPMVSTENNHMEQDQVKTGGIKVNEIAFVTAHHFKGFLSEKESVGYRWMRKETNRAVIPVDKDKKAAVSIVIKELKQTITPRLSNAGNARFEIEIQASATVSALYQPVTISYLNRELSKLIKKEVKLTYLAALKRGVDIYRLSETLYRKDIKAWRKIARDGKIPLHEDSISSLIVIVELKSSNQLKMTPSIE
ncbi:Ger(x)C family spore germination protein [Brevibacillus sp. AG]|uniref:Ger(x)C family spore germination protein n=1 Tax=Brevibacillus sp. AG TaxID=3020891 RepID=UPI0014803454|nr:Ger(x)C family spore germination protein [Brevibacillus sp. AG]MDC0765080.1 Ger(x)C family spore germination protein [Brevibacillus sp. AG]